MSLSPFLLLKMTEDCYQNKILISCTQNCHLEGKPLVWSVHIWLHDFAEISVYLNKIYSHESCALCCKKIAPIKLITDPAPKPWHFFKTVMPILMHFFIFWSPKVYNILFYSASAASTFSEVKPNVTQWEKTFCNDVRFLTVYTDANYLCYPKCA